VTSSTENGKWLIKYNDASKPNAEKTAMAAKSGSIYRAKIRSLRPIAPVDVWVVVLIAASPLNRIIFDLIE
jgi:hypothetical protein